MFIIIRYKKIDYISTLVDLICVGGGKPVSHEGKKIFPSDKKVQKLFPLTFLALWLDWKIPCLYSHHKAQCYETLSLVILTI